MVEWTLHIQYRRLKIHFGRSYYVFTESPSRHSPFGTYTISAVWRAFRDAAIDERASRRSRLFSASTNIVDERIIL